jgi:PAP2 superfamily
MTVSTEAPSLAALYRLFAMPADLRSATVARGVLALALTAALALVGALAATSAAGVPLRDPGGVTLRRLAVAGGLAVLLAVLDVLVRAARSERRRLPSRAALAAVRRERWTGKRAAVIAVAIVCFHVTYLGYRNAKSVIPLLAPGELWDRRLGDLERSVFGGDPAELLHTLLGTGASAQVLSAIYLLFFAFIPLAVTISLVCSSKLEPALFFVTALALNWVLAAISYRLLPALGPIYADPAAFAALPATGTSDLQATLLEQRTAFLADPDAPGAAQSIGAFASLHTSLYVTAALGAHLLGYPRLVRALLWVGLLGTVTATVYFGWHYVVDDLGGIVIAVAALALARVLTGMQPSPVRQPLPVPRATTA